MMMSTSGGLLGEVAGLATIPQEDAQAGEVKESALRRRREVWRAGFEAALSRPIFQLRLSDKKLLRKRNGHPVYSSELLSELWENKGSTELGSVTHASAAYVARYSMKKVTGKRADDHYWRVSPIDGESHRVASEFFTSSRRPGLGSSWFDKFKDDAFSFGRTESGRVSGVVDFVIVDGQRQKPSPYYLGKLKERDQKAVKRARKRASMDPQARADATPERLKVREFIKRDRMKRLIRPLG